MVTATSTKCTAHYPDLDLILPAGVPTKIDPKHIERVKVIDGVEVDENAPDPSTSATVHGPYEEI